MHKGAEYKEYIRSEDWMFKRKQAFLLFGRKCQKCGIGSKLHVHHKTYERFKKENIETDLAILCEKCHSDYHRQNGDTTIALTDEFLLTKILRIKSKQNKIKKTKKPHYLIRREAKMVETARQDDLYIFMKNCGLVR